MKELRVEDVMTNLVVSFRSSETLTQAARKLLRNRISGAPVLEQGRLVGLVSERDLVRAYAHPADGHDDDGMHMPLGVLVRDVARERDNHCVKDVMTTNVITVGPNEPVWKAASLMDRHGIRRLPVLDADGFVIGVIARADVVRAMSRDDETIRLDVITEIGLLGPENFHDLAVKVDEGRITLSGTADRTSTKVLALKLATRVPGVLEVVDRLEVEWDDSNVKPGRPTPDPYEIKRDPWAPGHLVAETNA